MEFSTKINSIDRDLTDANNEVDMVPCDGFAICGFIAEARERNPRNFWPFEESLGDQSVPMSRWWSCSSCTRNIDADGEDDTGVPSISRNELNGSSPVIPSQSQPNSPAAIDQEEERNTDHIAENAVVENEDVNCERSQNDDQRVNAVVENETVNRERSQQDDQTGNAVVVVNEDVNCARSQNDDKRVTRSSKKVHPPPFKTYALRNKGKRVAVPEPVGNNNSTERQNVEQLALITLASAAIEESTSPKASEGRSLFIGGVPCRKTRKVRTRRLKDLTDRPVMNNTRREEPSSQKESKKRKSRPGSSKRGRRVSTGGEISGSVFNVVDSEHGEPSDSGVDVEPIKGKKKNVRFQVDDDDEVAQEENVPEIDPPMATRRTMKVKKAKKRRTRSKAGPSKKASSSLQTIIEENETVPSPPREQRTEERVGNSLDDQLASDGYVRKPNPPVNEGQDNSSMRSGEVGVSYVPVFGNSSTPNTSRGLGAGPGAIYLGSRSNNNDNKNNQRSTSPSTVVADQSSVRHKDASVSDRKGKGVMVQSDDETENTQNDNLPDKEVDISNNLPQEVPQKPKTPFLFDLNETYEEDVPSLEENTNEAREEEGRVPVRSEHQNSVEMLPPRQNSYMSSPSVMMPPPPVQENRRSSILFSGHNPQWMGNVSVATHHHHHHLHPSPSPYQVISVPHQYGAPSPPVWASSSSMIPPQYHHHHHLSPPAPFNVDYSSMLAQQAQSSDTWNNLTYYGANLMNQAMMSGMDPRFRSNNPVNHHGNNFFTPRHAAPVNQFNPPVNQFSQLVELQRSHERPVYRRTISNQGRFQRRRNAASSSNASASRAENSSVSSSCVVSRNPSEISDIEPGNIYMVPEEALRVLERMAESENAEEHVGGVRESG